MTINAEIVPLSEFLNHRGLCVDVRAPREYAQGRIRGALNLPLFTDDERAQVGTLYKQVGKQAAVELGVRIISPKLPLLLDQVKSARAESNNPDEPLRVYCFRGGLRSSFAGWFFQFIGIKTKVLRGGYKAFRRYALETLLQPMPLIVLGGPTGSGKTRLLQELSASGEQVVDLEALAFHRGSSFGLAPGDLQPSTEQFENELACELLKCSTNKPIWVEDESRMIGLCSLPEAFFNRMKASPLFFVETPLEERIQLILETYGKYPEAYLISCTEKIQKRLGFERTRQAVEFIRAGELAKAVQILLQYYDTTYSHGALKHIGPKVVVPCQLISLLDAKRNFFEAPL